jgi:hypothetical protein
LTSKIHLIGQIQRPEGRPENVELAVEERADITRKERTAGIKWVDTRYEPGNVFRYGATGDGSTDDQDSFAKALSSGHEVRIPVPPSKYIINSGLTITDGTNIHGDSRDIVIRYGGSAATYLFTCTQATLDKGVNIDNLTLEPATNAVNGFKFIECRNVHLSRFNIIDDPDSANVFAIGVLFDDDAGTSPQVGSAWNWINDYFIQDCSDAGIRLDTQGTAIWCNRNYIGYGLLQNCGIGLDIDRGQTNICMGVCPQSCTTGVRLRADADFTFLLGYEEASDTNSLIIDANCTDCTIMGNWTVADISDSGTDTIWFANNNFKIPHFNDSIPVRAYTTTNIEDISHEVNTSENKQDGSMIWNTTTNKPLWSAGGGSGVCMV